MATITFFPQDDAGERILDELEQQLALEAEIGEDDGRSYPLDGDDHRVEIMETLGDIDADWAQHLTTEPAT